MSVQSTTGSRGVHIRGSNAGYTMFRGSVKSTGCPLHSLVSPSLPLPCVTVCRHISTGLYTFYTVDNVSESLPINQTSRHHTADDRKPESTYLRKYMHLRVYRPYDTRGNVLGHSLTFQLRYICIRQLSIGQAAS